ncbi:MAG: hypothetical protein LBD97_09620 [Bifidobacteriaceae bacterium]|nr:hypothetical protein [Bifidobacteriaceae bacterium]
MQVLSRLERAEGRLRGGLWLVACGSARHGAWAGTGGTASCAEAFDFG